MATNTKATDISNTAPGHHAWWKEGAVYQVWPASYKDSNGDGLGDIPGMTTTLDYLHDLGIDIIWLSPMYKSPQKDWGYDISDYEDIYPPYGTLADMDHLVAEMKRRNMKLLLDLVINHTSDQHKWFLESKSNRTNTKADWYHWKPPKYVNGQRHEPNNWRATFGGSAWTYVAERDEYYLHTFEPEQPDLNWENEACRQAIYDSAVRFWLKRGVAGFRMDVVNFYSKDMTFPDAPIRDPSAQYQLGAEFYVNGPRMHDYIRELRTQVFDPYGDIMTVGECPRTSFEETLDYVSEARNELRMIFDFDIVTTGGNLRLPLHEHYKPSLQEVKAALAKVQRYAAGTDSWATVFGENHDYGRSVSRFGCADKGPELWKRSAKVLAMLFACLTGTLFVYQGQEIGMSNWPDSWGPEELKDVASRKAWQEILERYPDDKDLHIRAMKGARLSVRDNVRTPVQWDSGEHAGFSTATPWCRVHDNYKEVNVAQQLKDPDSILAFWKKMLSVRKEYKELMVYGSFEMADVENEKTFTFIKEDAESETHVLVVLNFSEEEQPMHIPETLQKKSRTLLLGNLEGSGEMLKAWEGRIYHLN